MPTPNILSELPKHTREAVRFYWQTRAQQLEKQRKAGGSDQGLRSAVTGGAQMDGFIQLLTKLVIEAGIDAKHIYYRDSLELPGYFRPNKKWDLLVVVNCQLIAALEADSATGSSFGDNFESFGYTPIGRALDLWTTFRKQQIAVRPWAGYLLILEEPDSGNIEIERCESLCRRFVFERHYDSVALVASDASRHDCETRLDFGFDQLAWSLFTHVAAITGRIAQLSLQ